MEFYFIYKENDDKADKNTDMSSSTPATSSSAGTNTDMSSSIPATSSSAGTNTDMSSSTPATSSSAGTSEKPTGPPPPYSVISTASESPSVTANNPKKLGILFDEYFYNYFYTEYRCGIWMTMITVNEKKITLLSIFFKYSIKYWLQVTSKQF